MTSPNVAMPLPCLYKMMNESKVDELMEFIAPSSKRNPDMMKNEAYYAYYKLYSMGGRAKRHVREMPVYTHGSPLHGYGAASTNIETGQSVAEEGSDVEDEEQIDAYQHWAQEYKSIQEQLSRWQAFRDEQAQAEDDEGSPYRAESQDVRERFANGDMSERLMKTTMHLRDWRAYHCYQKTQLKSAAWNIERVWLNIKDTCAMLAAADVSKQEQRPGLINLHCQLDSLYKSWEKEDSLLDWIWRQIQAILEEALQSLSSSEVGQLLSQQRQDTNKILLRLERFSGTSNWHQRRRRGARVLDDLVSRETRIAKLSEALCEWKDILPCVAQKIEFVDDTEKRSSISREINENRQLWWKHMICRKDAELNRARSWVSCWQNHIQFWEETMAENVVWRNQYMLRNDWIGVGRQRRKLAQEKLIRLENQLQELQRASVAVCSPHQRLMQDQLVRKRTMACESESEPFVKRVVRSGVGKPPATRPRGERVPLGNLKSVNRLFKARHGLDFEQKSFSLRRMEDERSRFTSINEERYNMKQPHRLTKNIMEIEKGKEATSNPRNIPTTSSVPWQATGCDLVSETVSGERKTVCDGVIGSQEGGDHRSLVNEGFVAAGVPSPQNMQTFNADKFVRSSTDSTENDSGPSRPLPSSPAYSPRGERSLPTRAELAARIPKEGIMVRSLRNSLGIDIFNKDLNARYISLLKEVARFDKDTRLLLPKNSSYSALDSGQPTQSCGSARHNQIPCQCQAMTTSCG